MSSFTIKDLENLSGIKAHTIRIWEQRYSFLKPQRTETNIRYYTNQELKTILNISLLNKFGYKISQIDKMSEEEINQHLYNLTDASAQQERILNLLISYMVDMEMNEFERLLDDCIRQKGIERTIQKFIFPYLERIGILWQTDHINPAQEHLVTNIIRQKIIRGIEEVRPLTLRNKTALLFMPEGEYHELGLLYIYYLLKQRGLQVLYLGANVPYKDVCYLANVKKPDFIYSHITFGGSQSRMEKYLNHLRAQTGSIPIYISGQLAQYHRIAAIKGLILKKSVEEVLSFIAGFV